MSKPKEYVAQMQLQLDEWNLQLARLETQAGKAREEARVQFEAQIAKVREQSTAARSQFAELVAAGDETWEKMTVRMDKLRGALAHSLRDFKSQL